MGKIGSKLGSLAIIGGLIASLHFLHAQGIESSGGNMTLTLGYPSNSLWLSVASVSNGWLILTLNGTQPGSNYTLLSQATLTASNWSTAGLVTGAQNQSWTTAQLPLTDATLFVWAQYNGGSGGGTNGGGGGTAEDYGTGLWLKTGGVSNGVAGLSVVNSAQDILYEIEDKTNLLQSDWISCGFVYGSELTNWTPISVFAGNSGNLFLRIRSWEDSTGTGIPDWWWLQCFGQTTNVDPNASPAGDGYSNLQKFQMGLNSTNYYNPNTPGGFFGYVDSSGTNVYLMWNPAGGPVVNYAIQRGIYNTNTGNYDYSQFLLNSNATFFEDVGVVTNANAQNNIYNLEAVYPGGSLSATNTWYPIWYADWGSDGPPYGPPAPGNFDAYADVTGTNVQLSWTPAPGPATNYIIKRGIYNTGSATYDYTPIANVNTNATAFEVAGAITNEADWGESYGVVAVYPGGGLSGPATSYINIGSTDGPAAPNGFYGYADPTGTNIFLTWNSSPGAANYILYQGVVDYDTYLYIYHQIGKVNAGTNSFEVVGAITQPQDLYDYYKIVAVYPGGSLSKSAYWYVPGGAPGPDTLVAYLDSTGTNVLLSWTPAQSAMTGYVVKRSINYGSSYSQIAQVSPNTTSNEDFGGTRATSRGIPSLRYEVQATYPNGGLSPAVTASVSTNLPAPSGLSAVVDSTGTNVQLSWNPALGWVSNYIILRGTYNPNTGNYSYSQIATVSAGTTSYEDVGAVTGGNSNNNIYEVIADYGGGQLSSPNSSPLTPSSPSLTDINLTVTAEMVRNQTGRWQLMFSSIPTNVQTIALDWYSNDYFYDNWGMGPFADPDLGYPFSIETYIPVSSLTNGIYVIPDLPMVYALANGVYFNTGGGWDMELSPAIMVCPIAADGTYGNQIMAGLPPNDEPAFADGRQCLKQNLLFELRAATISQPNTSLGLPVDTNYVESSFFYWTWLAKGYNSMYVAYLAMDDLWPFKANYALHGSLYDPNYTGPSSFVWQTNVATIPAPAVLGVGDPYWISQPIGISGDCGTTIDPGTGLPVPTFESISISPDLAAYTNNGSLFLQSGAHNFFGLPFEAALVNLGGYYWYWNGSEEVEGYNPPITIAPGGSVDICDVSCFYSQTADPSLQLVNYYFAPVNTPGTALAGESTPIQPFPLPTLTGFAATNQTGVMIASVGTPTVIGGWAKFALQNSSKFAYLGQYYITNACMFDANGNFTTNATGIVSPYGDFFPTQPGMVAMVTMPDIDTGQQGTGVVRVVSLDADANHDGTMDFSYFGPDQTSPSRPMRFWANDSSDDGDYGGDGVPGQGAQGNAMRQNPLHQYVIQGRRDLVNFFPVYLNIGSLFQSNALSAGISYADTNWQFVLSQADGVLRFAYTDLTPTNYMNFLRDTAESGVLANWPGNPNYAVLTTISNLASGGALLAPSFVAGIATNNEGIILVEAAAPTTQPLVLTIYHGTNQIAQTSLYLSISGVEQMFRHKNLLLTAPPAKPDRLTDADVPNEPDTTDKNFVFLHGYNVLPNEARGVAADMFKRMYWSGSHAKFWAVTWEGADTKGTFPFYYLFTPDYHSNVFNAFNTAPQLANFIATLTNTGPVVAAAHSLGNMVTLSAISDWNAPISQYFMVDAAVAIEAIDPTSSNTNMIYSTWQGYTNRLFASDWWQLWPVSDNRSTLTWSNRVGNLRNVDVYNFYSSGEEVLREYDSNPPDTVLGAVTTEIWNALPWTSAVPFGTYAWYWQEKGKGACSQNWLLGSDHGGWKFNSSYDIFPGGMRTHLPPARAATNTTTMLQTNAFFDFGNYVFSTHPDYVHLQGSDGSSYAQTNRNRILSDAIPALSLVAGANPVQILGATHNFNMSTNTFENNWPQGRLQQREGNNWHHSDFHEVAYIFTWPLFDKFVTLGNLK